MKKVAIYTWCYDIGRTNYGQTLQCYAMCEIIKRLGGSPYVIRYRHPNNDEILPEFDEVKRKEYERQYRITRVEAGLDERVEKFFSFIDEYIPCSIPCYSEAEVEYVTRDADILLTGSDQLWAPQWFDPISLFRFYHEGQKRVSYATSGVEDLTESGRKVCREIGDEITKFNAVSVREKSSAEVLKKYVGEVEIIDTIDPTMLLEWDGLTAKSEKNQEEYILCYFLGTFTHNKVVLKELLKKYGVNKVFYIKSNLFPLEGVVSEDIFFEARSVGPVEFVSLIKNAKAVYTDSFHGCVFSVIYGKPFFTISYLNPGRIFDLCNKLNINYRTADCIKQLRKLNEIDYEAVKAVYERWRQESCLFIENQLR